MSMGTRERDRQPAMWVTTTDLPTAASHSFYRRLNQLLREHGFDDFVEAQCASSRFPPASASLTAGHNRGSINAPNVMLCMPIGGGASAARAANVSSADAANCSMSLRASL